MPNITSVAMPPTTFPKRRFVWLPHHLFIVADEEDQEHQGRGHQTIDGCGIVQSSHRIDPDKIDRQSDERGDGDDAIETMRLLQFLTQTRLPTKKFGNGVG